MLAGRESSQYLSANATACILVKASVGWQAVLKTTQHVTTASSNVTALQCPVDYALSCEWCEGPIACLERRCDGSIELRVLTLEAHSSPLVS
jgi:hypothetical protein